VEEAQAYKRLMQEYNYTQEELARRIGKSRPSIANSIRLLSLPDEILKLLAQGEISAGQVRPLLTISDPHLQQEAARQIIEEGLSAREAEKMAAKIAMRPGGKRDPDNAVTLDPIHAELQTQIQRSLGTKVRLKQGKNGGTIEIFYYSEEDLERLVAKMLPEGI